MKSIKEKIEHLRNKIELQNYNYYILDRPQIEDYEYDDLVQELSKLEQDYPQYSNDKSPTQNVGGSASTLFAPIKHDIKMESLNNAFSYEQLQKFDTSVRNKIADLETIEYILEPKIDGLSVSLKYVDGKLVCGTTRGDGEVGEDVTQNLKTIKSIPYSLNTSAKLLEVRGEVFISKDNFELINSKIDGKSRYSSSRNLASGSLRQLDTNSVAERNLDIYIFNLQQVDDPNFRQETHIQNLKHLKSLGFKVVKYYGPYYDLESAWERIQSLQKNATELAFNADGIVLKINSINQREVLGSTSKAPKWAIAYKFPVDTKETKLIDVDFLVGKSGVITPIAILEPVFIDGSLIKKASLHNFDIVLNKGFRIGDVVKIRKAGDVIPEVLEPVLSKRNGNEKNFEIPKKCPECKLDVIFENDQYKCSNLACNGRLIRKVIHFASRDAMNIAGFGDSIIRQLVEYGFVKQLGDIYDLTYHDLMQLDNISTKSALKLIENIKNSQQKSLDKLIYALSIENVGKRASKILANHFEKLEYLFHVEIEQLLRLPDIGKETAQSIKKYFNDKYTQEDIAKIIKKRDKIF